MNWRIGPPKKEEAEKPKDMRPIRFPHTFMTLEQAVDRERPSGSPPKAFRRGMATPPPYRCHSDLFPHRRDLYKACENRTPSHDCWCNLEGKIRE